MATELTPRGLQRQRWEAIASHLEKWFYQPDLQALEIILSVAYAHNFPGKGEKPVWIFVIGASGSAKTSIVPDVLEAGFSNVTVASEISDKTFLSGFQPRGREVKGRGTKKAGSKKAKDYSMLSRMGESAILCFKDFTTFISLDHQKRASIAAQLREIWDGKTSKDVGSHDEQIKWEGKLTIIACATRRLEKAWSVYRSMGDRFLTVRWLAGDPIETAAAAAKQQGHVEEISAGLKRAVKDFLNTRYHTPPPDTEKTGLVYLARLVAWVRTQVERSGKEIVDIDEEEMPTRLNMALARVAQAHASLFNHEQVEEEDLAAARRVALDTIPSRRRTLIELLPAPPEELSLADIIDQTGLHANIIKTTMEELEAIGVVRGDKTDTGYYWRATDEFQVLKVRAGLMLDAK